MKDYEVSCTEIIVNVLGASSVYCETAIRHFRIVEEPLAFSNAEAALRLCSWEKLPSNTAKYALAAEIEVDCLLHIHSKPAHTLTPKPPIFLVSPTKSWLSSNTLPSEPSKFKGFSKKISTNANDDNTANVYNVFEITIDKNQYAVKLAQLERDLTILLHRQRLDYPLVQIEDIVGYAGVATTTMAIIHDVRAFVEVNCAMLPQLSTLLSLDRLLVVKVKPDATTYTRRKLSDQSHVIYSVRFFGVKCPGSYSAISNYIDYSKVSTCESIMRNIGLSLSTKPGYRLQVLKFDKETGTPGHEIAIDVSLYSIVGTQEVELLVTGVQERMVFTDMEGFYKGLKENHALDPDEINIVKSVFITQKIKFEQLMATGNLALTDEALKQVFF
ncbi:hypothetical protein BDR26DRAFT_668164 [Obelidium mucronatum]|nr:hypothetical protein BDR26DRAFT_668164 [Obelidium mucronatum]